MSTGKQIVYVLMAGIWAVLGVALGRVFEDVTASSLRRNRNQLPAAIAAAALGPGTSAIKASIQGPIQPVLRQVSRRRGAKKASLPRMQGLQPPSRDLGLRLDPLPTLFAAKAKPGKVIRVAQGLMGRRDIASIGSFRVRVKFSGRP